MPRQKGHPLDDRTPGYVLDALRALGQAKAALSGAYDCCLDDSLGEVLRDSAGIIEQAREELRTAAISTGYAS